MAGDSSTVRRSPRLTGRFTGYRDDGGMGHRNTHATISTVSSRPSLRSYGRTKKTESETSILNESGQSVPVSFDEEEVARRKKSGLPEHFFGKLCFHKNKTKKIMLALGDVRESPHFICTYKAKKQIFRMVLIKMLRCRLF